MRLCGNLPSYYPSLQPTMLGPSLTCLIRQHSRQLRLHYHVSLLQLSDDVELIQQGFGSDGVGDEQPHPHSIQMSTLLFHITVPKGKKLSGPKSPRLQSWRVENYDPNSYSGNILLLTRCLR